MQSTIAERLLAVAPHLGDDEYFLATYGDGLTDAPLPDMIERLESSGKTGLFLSVRPMFNAHVVDADADGIVRSIDDIQQADVWINGGFFVFRRDVLDYINPGEELVDEPFARLIERGRADRVPVRGLLGADGHDQGQAAARRARRERPRALARRAASGATSVADAPALAFAATRRCAVCSPSARTPTTSRSAAAPRCSRSRGRTRARGHMGRPRRDGRARATRRGRAPSAFLARPRGADVDVTGSATATSRTSAATSRTCSRS